MLRPSMSQILKPGESYYEFVVAVARKAREIASKAEAQHEALEEKPVTWRYTSSPAARKNSPTWM